MGDEQDWPVELANKLRVGEFIKFILEQPLSLELRKAVMALILTSYEDLSFSDEDKNLEVWKKVVEVLNIFKGQFDHLLTYWALWDEESQENWFSITPLVRGYLGKQQNKEL